MLLEYCCETHWYQNFCVLHIFQVTIEFNWELILGESSNVNVMKDNGGKIPHLHVGSTVCIRLPYLISPYCPSTSPKHRLSVGLAHYRGSSMLSW